MTANVTAPVTGGTHGRPFSPGDVTDLDAIGPAMKALADEAAATVFPA